MANGLLSGFTSTGRDPGSQPPTQVQGVIGVPGSEHPQRDEWRWEQDAQFRFTHIHVHESQGDFPHKAKLGRARWELGGALPLDMTWDEHRAQLQACQPFSDFKYLVFLNHGTPRYLSCDGEPVFDEAGRLVGYRGITRDITERWIAERQRRDSAAMLKIAATLGRLGAWSLCKRTMQIAWSDEVCGIHNVAPGYVGTAEDVLTFCAPGHREALRTDLMDCLHRGLSLDRQLEILVAGKGKVWVRVMGEAQRDATGRVVGIHGALQDVSRAEAAAEESLRLSQSLRAIMESLADGFYVLDRSWRFVYVNDEACRLFRRTREQLVGKVLWEELPEAVGTDLHTALERALAEGAAVELEECCAPLGLWYRLRACPSPDGLAVSFVDITPRKRAEAQLMQVHAEMEERVAQRTAELQAATREMEVLAYAVAHDLRAPLSAVIGYSEMLKEQHVGELRGKGDHFVQRINAAARQMDAMTEGILALARLAGTEIHREEIDLSAIAREVVATMTGAEPGRPIEIVIAPGIRAVGDLGLVTRVVGNLIENAWKFTRNAQAPRIELGKVTAHEGESIYFVRDNGAGFDSTYASRLFLPFSRLHTTAEFPGTGIGLSITWKIVRMHGGHIWAESCPGAGATFFFTLD